MIFLKIQNQSKLKFSSAGNLVNNGGFLHIDRCLDTFVLLVVNTGELYISQNGELRTLRKNQYIVLYPGMRHFGFRPSDGNLNYYWCHFSIPKENYALLNASAENEDHTLLPEYGECLAPEKVSLQFRHLIDLSLHTDTVHIKDLAISLLIAELMDDYALHQQKENHGSNPPNIIRIVDYIEHNYTQNISTKTLSAKFGYNPNYLSMLFRKCIGLPLTHYINQVRINAAKSLLLNSSNTIKAIAMQVGYVDEKYFMKVFKTFEQTTPTRFRNLYAHTHTNTH